MRFLVTLFILFSFVSCAAGNLNTRDHYEDQPGFTIDEEAVIPDTLANREVIDVLLQYQNALVRKDFGSLKRLISPNYFDNSGTTNTTVDDYDHKTLTNIFETMAKHSEDIKYKIVLKSIEILEKKAFLDYEFEYAYAHKVGGELSWDAGVDVNRLELVSENGEWKIISGL